MVVSRSESLYHRACSVTPGGVNSPVRAFRSVGGTPVFMASGSGPYLVDEDAKQYVDFVGSWGPIILGHTHQTVLKAVSEALVSGVSFGTPTRSEVLFAELLCSILPHVEMIRFVSSGTEATMSAIRLARAATGRDRIIKFSGCYHGHADSFLVQAGSGLATLSINSSPGVPKSLSDLSICLAYNDLAAVEHALAEVGPDTVAAIIVEPVAGNMGLVRPAPGFLQGLRALCSRYGIVLIFDEVMSGFRVALGGATELFDVTPDLATYGKVIGGGLPVGAFGGRKDLMSLLAPQGPVYQAGTLSGNPVAIAAGMATVELLRDENPYEQLELLGRRLTHGMCNAARDLGIAMVSDCIGGMFGFFFSPRPVCSYEDAAKTDTAMFSRFFHRMLANGVYLPPSPYETCFMSIAHTSELIDQVIGVCHRSLAESLSESS